MENENKKLCSDCAFYVVNKLTFRSQSDFAKCSHPNYLSLVDGMPHIYCSGLRRDGAACGIDAKLFKPKESAKQ